jgi:hypothetical protein
MPVEGTAMTPRGWKLVKIVGIGLSYVAALGDATNALRHCADCFKEAVQG